MPGRYTGQLRSGGGSSGGGGGRYTSQIRAGGGGGGKRGKQKKDEGRHGVGGFFGNLYEDVKSSVTGLPGFAAHAGVASWHDLQQFNRDPFHWHSSQLAHDIVVPAAKATAHTWSPLVLHGDIGETGRRVYADPLSILDLAAGAGLAAKGLRAADLIAEAPRTITLRAPSGATITRPVVGGELGRRLKIGADEALKRLPPDFQVKIGGRTRTISVPLSEEHRYARAVRSRGDKYQAGLTLQGRFYGPALARLSKNEEIASNLRQDYPLRADLDRAVARLRGGEPPLQSGYVRLYRGESTAYRAVDLSDPVARANAALNRGGGQGRWFSDSRRYAKKFAPKGGSALRYVDIPESELGSFRHGPNEYLLPEDIATSARDLVLTKGVDTPTIRVMTDPNVLKFYENPTAKMHAYEQESKILGEEGANLLGLTDTEQRAYLSSLLARGAAFHYKPLLGTDADLGRSVRWNGREGKLVKIEHPDTRVGEPTAPLLGPVSTPNLPVKLAQEYAMNHDPFANYRRIRKDVEDLDRRGTPDEQYMSVVSSLGREIKWDKFPDRRTAILAKVDELEARIKQRYGMDPNDPVPPPPGAAVIPPTPTPVRSAVTELAEPTAMLKLPGKGGKGVYTKTVPLSEVTQTAKELVAPGRRTIEGMIQEIRAEAAASGRPLPQYRPHKSVEEPARTGGVGGRVPAYNPGRQQNQGILASMGRVAYDIDTLGPQWARSVKYAVYNDRHANLMRAAVPVEKLPQGWEFVKTKRSDRIGYTEKTAAEFEQRLEDLLPDPELDSLQGLKEELTTRNPDEALVDENGLRLAVPSKVANTITGEYVSQSRALRWLWEKPTDVWRALVLNLRVGWLVNNVVGNTFLYAIKNAGLEGLKAYLRALQDVKGTVAVRRVLNDEKVRNRLTPDDIAEILPEQVAGTFFGTQAAKQGRVMRAVGKPTKALRTADVAYEQALRRAMINRLVRTNPEFKRFYNRLPKETRNFRQAAKKHLEDNPELVDRISKQVNDTLGDFFSLSRFERTALRGVAPFFAWYRAITLIALKLPVDHPIRAAILLKLGQVGDEYTEDFGVPYLEGAIPLGGNEILKTRGVNPLVTPFDTGEAVVAGGQATAGVPGVNQNAAFNFLGMLNPLAIAAIQGVASQSRGEYPARGSGLYGVARGLPETQLFAPFDSKLYEGDARRRAILSYLGVPIVRVNPAEARKR